MVVCCRWYDDMLPAARTYDVDGLVTAQALSGCVRVCVLPGILVYCR